MAIYTLKSPTRPPDNVERPTHFRGWRAQNSVMLGVALPEKSRKGAIRYLADADAIIAALRVAPPRPVLDYGMVRAVTFVPRRL